MEPVYYHAALELLGVLCCVVVACVAWAQHRRAPTAWTFLWSAGFANAAVLDTMHATMPLVAGHLSATWIPITWATSRVALGSLLLLGALWARRDPPRHAPLMVSAACALTLAAFIALESAHASWVLRSGTDVLIHRPLDLVCAGVWAAALAALLRVPAARMQAPTGVHWLMAIGVVAHLTMATSSGQIADASFWIAHVIKASVYAGWMILTLRAARGWRRGVETSARTQTAGGRA